MLAIFAAMAAGVVAPQMPVWMAGCWESQAGDRSTVECWSMPSEGGTVMEGESVSRAREKVVERETMQIVLQQTDDPAIPWMTFRAIPNGAQPTVFGWIPAGESGLTFVNREHDYPQRIRYWREGGQLLAEISAADGSKARRWRYSPRGR